MTYRSQATAPEIHHDRSAAPSQLFGVLTKFGGGVKAGATSVLRTLQMARMLSMLSNLSDFQLSQIGIARSEIPAYAKKLLTED